MKRHGSLAMLAGSAIAFSQLASAQLPPPPPTPRGVCVSNCGPYPAPPVYTGPSPEELRRLREAKDSREAAEDAEDRGVDAYEKGDFEGAARWFKEALEFDPDSDTIRTNLAKAEQKAQAARAARARAADAARQLMSVQQHSTTAVPGADSREARQGFDTGGRPAGTIPVYAGRGARPDPVIPVNRRTPAIAALERQRTDAKQKIKALEEKIGKLDPKKDSVAIAKAKQERSNEESKVNFVNFSISEALAKPAAVPAQ
jgi:tetratricopeptide (TPR) repeat protein